MKNIFLLIFTVFFLIAKTSGLKCYTCSLKEDDSDTHCLDNPGTVEGDITDCDKKYCTIVRQDYKDPRGKLQSMTRSCTDVPIYINQVVEDETHRQYFRSCRTDLCNLGTGHSNAQDEARGSFGDKSTIYCPGTDESGGTLVTVTVPIIIISIFLGQFAR
ncbi:uncharacterized protein [Leptinotarsa decemlineata]|uniref:uncharacterized protein n=1 Tax=Leptinotarsa decemlineata TaxID=7539 RepID=UPI003D308611